MHGDVIAKTDDNGNIINKASEYYPYEAFGIRKAENDYAFGYCGEMWDSESGFVYLRNRMYDPRTGAFLTEDPNWNVRNMVYGDNIEHGLNEIEQYIWFNIMFGHALGNTKKVYFIFDKDIYDFSKLIKNTNTYAFEKKIEPDQQVIMQSANLYSYSCILSILWIRMGYQL